MLSSKNAYAALLCFVLLLKPALTQAQHVDRTQRVAPGVYEVVFNPQDEAIYVTAAGSREQSRGYVYTLDAGDLTVRDSIDVRSAPAYGLGFNAATQTLYTSNTRDNSVHAIDAATGEVLATLDHGRAKSHVRELVVDEASNQVYVSDYGKPGNVWVIDGATNTFSHLIEATGEGSTGIALNRAEQRLYVANMASNEIAVVDLERRAVVDTYTAHGDTPTNVAFDEDGNRLFVANQGSGTLTVLDASTGALQSTVETGEGALGVTYDDVRERIFVANRGAGTVSVIDAGTYEVLANLETGPHPNTVAVDPDTGAAFVTNKAGGSHDGADAPASAGDTVTKIAP